MSIQYQVGTALVFIAAWGALHSATAAPVSKRDAAMAQFNEARERMHAGSGRTLGSHLAALEAAQSAANLQGRAGAGVTLATKMRALRLRDGYVQVSAYPDSEAGAEALRATLTSKGMLDGAVQGNAVTGRVPVAALKDMAGTAGLRFMRPSMFKTNAGHINSQGDRAQRSDIARQRFGVSGQGVRIGVMSDSFNCLTGPVAEGSPYTTAQDDIASGDLPSDIIVVKDYTPTPDQPCTDEGRAMMQLIHDVAPGASLAFHTVGDSEEEMAAGIDALVKAGANIIVDDVLFFAEPMFQDGIIAQAADRAVSRGVAYFGSAGNEARASYESRFRNSRRAGLEGGPMHDFDPGRGVDTAQSVTAQAQSLTLLVLQWDQPFFSVSGGRGSATDLDAYFVDADGAPIEFCSDDPDQVICQIPGLDSNLGADAIEEPLLVNFSDQDLEAHLVVEVFDGQQPSVLKYNWFDFANGVYVVNEFDTQSGTTYGHHNSARSEAIGAAAFFNTAVFGQNHPTCIPACAENFSSAGGVPIYFDTRGRRLPFPSVRLKPGVTGPDGGETTFFYADLSGPAGGTDEPNGIPNFFGTSASAPHVAAIGALMIEKRRNDNADRRRGGGRDLSPESIYWALRLTAGDIRQRAGRISGPFDISNSRGYDFDTGFGFVDAVKALQFISD
jgi:hypothetical protein